MADRLNPGQELHVREILRDELKKVHEKFDLYVLIAVLKAQLGPIKLITYGIVGIVAAGFGTYVVNQALVNLF